MFPFISFGIRGTFNKKIDAKCFALISHTTKGGSRRLKKSREVWMTMMIAASLIWAGVAEKPEQSKMTNKNHPNDLKQLT